MTHLVPMLHHVLLQFEHSWEKQGLLPFFATCKFRKIPPPLSDTVSLQCNRNNLLFLGYSWIPKALGWPDTNASRPCKWGGLYNLCTPCRWTLPLCQVLQDGHNKRICKNNPSVYPHNHSQKLVKQNMALGDCEQWKGGRTWNMSLIGIGELGWRGLQFTFAEHFLNTKSFPLYKTITSFTSVHSPWIMNWGIKSFKPVKEVILT